MGGGAGVSRGEGSHRDTRVSCSAAPRVDKGTEQPLTDFLVYRMPCGILSRAEEPPRIIIITNIDQAFAMCQVLCQAPYMF